MQKGIANGHQTRTSWDVDVRLDQDDGRNYTSSPWSVSSPVSSVSSGRLAPAETLRTNVTYARRRRGTRIGNGKGSKGRSARNAGLVPLLAGPRMHAVELKLEGPHLCDLPQDFAPRLHVFLTQTLGMAPLHVAVSQGCIHLMIMLLEVGRGAAVVGPSAQRLRRRCAGEAASLPARLLTFMSQMLSSSGGEGAPGNVTVRHHQMSYDLDRSGGADSEGSSQGQQRSGAARVGRSRLLPPRTVSEEAAAGAGAGDEDDDNSSMEAMVRRTDPAGTRSAGAAAGVAAAAAADAAAAATATRLSTVTSAAAVGSAGDSSGGIWGSSGAGVASRSWVGWSASSRRGAITSAAESCSPTTSGLNTAGGGGAITGSDGAGTDLAPARANRNVKQQSLQPQGQPQQPPPPLEQQPHQQQQQQPGAVCNPMPSPVVDANRGQRGLLSPMPAAAVPPPQQVRQPPLPSWLADDDGEPVAMEILNIEALQIDLDMRGLPPRPPVQIPHQRYSDRDDHRRRLEELMELEEGEQEEGSGALEVAKAQSSSLLLMRATAAQQRHQLGLAASAPPTGAAAPHAHVAANRSWGAGAAAAAGAEAAPGDATVAAAVRELVSRARETAAAATAVQPLRVPPYKSFTRAAHSQAGSDSALLQEAAAEPPSGVTGGAVAEVGGAAAMTWRAAAEAGGGGGAAAGGGSRTGTTTGSRAAQRELPPGGGLVGDVSRMGPAMTGGELRVSADATGTAAAGAADSGMAGGNRGGSSGGCSDGGNGGGVGVGGGGGTHSLMTFSHATFGPTLADRLGPPPKRSGIPGWGPGDPSPPLPRSSGTGQPIAAALPRPYQSPTTHQSPSSHRSASPHQSPNPHMSPNAGPHPSGNANPSVISIRPYGTGGTGCNTSSGISARSMLGGAGCEIPEALARMLMPQVPLALPRPHGQPLVHPVDLLSPAVVIWPLAPPPPSAAAISPQEPCSIESLQTPDSERLPRTSRGRVARQATAAVQELQLLQPLRQSPVAAAGTGERAPSVGLSVLMRCPDVIASAASGDRRRRERLRRRRQYGSRGGGAADGARRAGAGGSGAGGGPGDTVGGDGSSYGGAGGGSDSDGSSSTWDEPGSVEGREHGAETGLGLVSQLVAWNRGGVIPLLQLDDSAEGWTRATLLLQPPSQTQQQQPEIHLPQSPTRRLGAPMGSGATSGASPAVVERARAAVGHSRSLVEVPTVMAGSACGSSRGLGATTLERVSSVAAGSGARSRSVSYDSRGAANDNARRSQTTSSATTSSAGGGAGGAAPSVGSGLAAPAPQLLYVAWRRGQSLGPPCPLLLLPPGLEDVVSELQAMQTPSSAAEASVATPPPAQQLFSYRAFLADLGTWLEALYASTATSLLGSSASSLTSSAAGGGGGALRQRSNPWLPSRPGTTSGAAAGSSANARSVVSAAVSPVQGDTAAGAAVQPQTPSSALVSTTWRAAAPAPLRGTNAAATAAATAAPAMAAAQDAGHQESEPPYTQLPYAQPRLQSHGMDSLSPFRTGLAMQSSAPQLPYVSPQRALSVAPAATAARPSAVQSQRVPSSSTVLSSTDSEERRARFAEEVVGMGCDLLSHAVARGAVATARLIMGLLLTHGSRILQLSFVATGGGFAAGAAGLVTSASAGAAGAESAAVTAAAAAAAATAALERTSQAVVAGGIVTGGSEEIQGISGSGSRQKEDQRMLSAVAGFGTGGGGETSSSSADGDTVGESVRAAVLRVVIELCRSNNESGQTLLHLAILSRSMPMLRLLLETWPQEYDLPVSELNRLDGSGNPPVAYLASAAAAQDDGNGVEFAAAAEQLLLALGPPLPSGDPESTVTSAEQRVAVRWGLHAVQEVSSEASSLGAAARLASPGGQGATTIVSGGSGLGEESAQYSLSPSRGRGRALGGDVAAAAAATAAAAAGAASWLRLGVELADEGQLPGDDSSRLLAGGNGAAGAGAAAAAIPAEAVQGIMLRDLIGRAPTVVPGLRPSQQQEEEEQLGAAGPPPLLSWALWASIQMLLGSVQALIVLLFAMPRSRNLPPTASLVLLPGCLLWLPSMCLVLSSTLSAVAVLLPPLRLPLPARWRAAAPAWLPAVLTSAGRTLSCVMSLAAAVELSAAQHAAGAGASGGLGDSSAGGEAGRGGLLTLMAGGSGMSGAEASMRMLMMTLAPTALEASYVEPGVRAVLLVSEYGLPLLYVALYDSIPAAFIWLSYAAANVVLGMALLAVLDLHTRVRAMTTAEAEAPEPIPLQRWQ